MSHGPSTEGSKAEPNLTPLLDVVLQLLMFFMMCVNFVNEQVDKNIVLPDAQSARPMEKGEITVLFLNMDSKGALTAPGGQDTVMTSLSDINYYLKKQFADAERADKLNGGTGVVNTTIVIRADRNANYSHVYQLLQTSKQAGYRKWQFRAITKAKG